MGAGWSKQLPWLSWYSHTLNAAQAAALQKYFTKHPEQAKVATKNGWLPLQWAVRHEGKHAEAIVEFLLKAYPAGAEQEMDQLGQIPLHYAAYHQTGKHGAAVVTLLLDAHPDGARQKNKDGHLPLHVAAFNQSHEHAAALVRLLLNAYPNGVQQKDIHGRLPLHHAAHALKGEHGAAIVTLLLTAYPAGAMQKDKYGRLPTTNADLPSSCIAMLRAAAEGKWRSVIAQGKEWRRLLRFAAFCLLLCFLFPFLFLSFRLSY